MRDEAFEGIKLAINTGLEYGCADFTFVVNQISSTTTIIISNDAAKIVMKLFDEMEKKEVSLDNTYHVYYHKMKNIDIMVVGLRTTPLPDEREVIVEEVV